MNDCEASYGTPPPPNEPLPFSNSALEKPVEPYPVVVDTFAAVPPSNALAISVPKVNNIEEDAADKLASEPL